MIEIGAGGGLRVTAYSIRLLHNMRVEEIMTRDVVTISADATVADAARLLTENLFGGLPVVDAENRLVGMITEGDMMPKLKGVPFSSLKLYSMFGDWFDEHGFEEAFAQAKKKTVGEVMGLILYTIEASEEVSRAATILSEQGIKRLPVTKDGELVGIVTRADIIRALTRTD